jgi:hypothetical protein
MRDDWWRGGLKGMVTEDELVFYTRIPIVFLSSVLVAEPIVRRVKAANNPDDGRK